MVEKKYFNGGEFFFHGGEKLSNKWWRKIILMVEKD